MDLVWISAKRLASASYDGTARIWDTEAGLLEGECVHELVEHQVRRCYNVSKQSTESWSQERARLRVFRAAMAQ